MPLKDPEARRAYKQAYYEANRTKLLRQQKDYKSAHPNEQRQKNHASYQRRRETILAKQIVYRQEHQEEIRQRNVVYRAKNQEQIKEQKRQDYYANHAARRLEANQRRAKNRAYFIARARHWYQTHKEQVNTEHAERLRNDPLYREQVNARQRTNYAKRMAHLIAQGPGALQRYREAVNAAQRAWRQANPEKAIAKVERRRALKEGANRVTLSAAQWEEIKIAFDHRCAYCNRKMQRLTQDHITPLSQQGDHHLHNVIPACQSCNSKKNAGPPLAPVQPLLLTIAPEEPKRTVF